eukprot:c8316_g1_i1.p1 GENE.c8316_g1_i1~~c8316_g1_i1.p1  ORF type:complete len:160 (+),score=32.01 c8316_g1_i1:46-525(+)
MRKAEFALGLLLGALTLACVQQSLIQINYLFELATNDRPEPKSIELQDNSNAPSVLSLRQLADHSLDEFINSVDFHSPSSDGKEGSDELKRLRSFLRQISDTPGSAQVLRTARELKQAITATKLDLNLSIERLEKLAAELEHGAVSSFQSRFPPSINHP